VSLPLTIGNAQAMLGGPSALLAQATSLISIWKPILIFVLFLGWAWMVSTVLDKHAARFYLERQMWNLIHLCVALVALAAVVLLPLTGAAAFWAAFGIVVALLGGDILAFVLITNRDDRVPDEHHLRFDLSSFTEARKQRADAKRAGRAELEIMGPKGLVSVPDQESADFALRLSAERVVLDAQEARAAQVVVRPAGKENLYAVMFLVDGVYQPPRSMPGPEAIRIIDFWKGAAGLDVEDRRRRLSGEVKTKKGEEAHTLRITASGGQGGMQMAIRFDPAQAVRRKLDDMGMLAPQLEEFRRITADPSGVVLTAGPPSSGRTTTLYALLKQHDAYTQVVQTIEIDPQDSLEGVTHNRFDPQAEGPEYATLVRTILRRDPDVVGIAELPDAETARNIVRADLERSRVYLSMRADTALHAIQLWTKYVGDLEEASEGLHGVIAQKLVRKLCLNCRVPYQPSKEMLGKLGLPADKVKQLFKKGGQVLVKNKPDVCPACSGVGYMGQIGVFEVYQIKDGDRQAIKSGDLNALRAELRKRQLPSMQQAALRAAVDGVTSIEEILRVSGEGGGTSGKGSASKKKVSESRAEASPA